MPANVRSSASFRASTFTSTKSRNHLGLILMSGSQIRTALSKLFQEPEVPFIEELNIVNPVAQHRDALHAHAEGEAAELFGIVVHETKDVRVHHTAPQQLNPPALLAESAWAAVQYSGAIALETADLDVGA